MFFEHIFQTPAFLRFLHFFRLFPPPAFLVTLNDFFEHISYYFEYREDFLK